ncbi:MAG: IclR family transcriptional regulator, partial [Lachnospiraceae bacterium]|nr:IclR family transcriptional regulator [Lachnospiraceae bacterium]
EYTITDPAELIKVIGQVREKGYALDNEENEIGVRCVAAALPPIPGRGRFAFSISAPAARMDDERIREVAGSLLRIRDRITQELRIG